MTRVVGIGAGGHARVLIDALSLGGEVEIVGLTDVNSALWGSRVLGFPVIGDDQCLERIFAEGVRHAFIGVGGSGDNRPRRKAYERARQIGFEIIATMHPRAVVAAGVRMGLGPMLLANAVVNTQAVLGDNVIINTGAIVEHDCLIGDHAHVSPGAVLCGCVSVGAEAHIGAGATVRQGICIGARAVVGAGAVVVKDVSPGVTVVGVPGKPMPAAHIP